MYLENYWQVNKDIRKLRRRLYPYIGVTKDCTSFLFGIKFTVVADNRSLRYIFDSHSSLSKGTSNMLQRWALQLSIYDYDYDTEFAQRLVAQREATIS